MNIKGINAIPNLLLAMKGSVIFFKRYADGRKKGGEMGACYFGRWRSIGLAVVAIVV